jgi:isopentenyl-diphosphate delta-isomerase
VLAAYVVARKFSDSIFLRVPLVALLTIVFDLVLDPGSVKIGFWAYDAGGYYYGVPVSNYFGWLISGLIGAAVIELFVYLRKPLLPVPVQLIASAFLTLFFWTFIALFSGLTAPMAIGLVFLVTLVLFYRTFHYAFDDMIVMVDEDNNAIGTARKLQAHDLDTKRHRAFSVFLFNSAGELLLQQRALSKKTWPGVWSNSCCGHVMLHENVADAAKRRLRYELGISRVELQMMLPEFRYRAEKDGVVENEICPVLVGFTDAQPRPNPSEVNDFQWIDWKQFVAQIASGKSVYSPWAIEEVLLLADNAEFKTQLNARSGNVPHISSTIERERGKNAA